MRTVCLLAALVVALLPARAAEACTFILPSLASGVGHWEGRTDVPTNLVMLSPALSPESFAAQPTSLWLRRVGEDDEAVVQMEATFDDDFTRIRAPEALDPNTGYELLVFAEPTLPVVGEGMSLEDVAQFIVKFETGEGPDDEPPPLPTLLRSERQEVFPSVPFFEDSCGLQEGGTWARFFLAPHEDVFALRLERDEPSVIVDARYGLSVDMEEHFVSEIAREAAGLHEYRITAIDLAGNESEPFVEAAYLGCPGTCASGDPAPLGLVLGLLTLRFSRRRRSV